MRVSACYIVKDEAEALAKSLASLQGSVDEIIMAATGTSPEAAAVARRYGAKVVPFAWQDDFAAARNAALAEAAGDWVVFLDADEYFSPATAPQLRAVLEKHAQDEALLMQIRNIDKDTQAVLVDFFALRAFRRREGRGYVGCIHEELQQAGKPVPGVAVPPGELAIIHTGYSAAFSREKAERNLRLLLAELKTAPAPQRLYMYLAEAYDGLGDEAAAMRYAYLDIANGRQPVSYASRSYRILMRCLAANRAAYEQRFQVAQRAAADFPELPEFQAELAECLAYRFDYAAAVAAAKRALALFPGYQGLEPMQFDAAAAAMVQKRIGLWEQIQERQGTLRISACAIVKDEAADIVRWIASVRQYADEIVLVDTGSTDGTAELARKAGVTVHSYVWADDFSAARNFALEKAQGDWIVFLDADETFAHPERVRPFLAETEVLQAGTDAVMVPIANIDADEHNREIQRFVNTRLFRRSRELRYVGRVHESVRRTQGEMKLLVEAQRLLVYHTGYSTGRIRQKIARNLKLLQADIAEHGEGPQHYRYLADCWFGLKEYGKALHYAQLALDSELVSIGSDGDMYHEALEAMRQLKRPDGEMLVLAEKAIARYPKLPDFYAEKGMVLCGLGRFNEAQQALEHAVQLFEQPQDSSGEASYFAGVAPVAYRRLGELYWQAGCRAEAEAAVGKSLQRDRYQRETLELYCRMHAAEEPAVLAGRLAAFYDAAGTDQAYLARQMEKLGLAALYEHYAAGLPDGSGSDGLAELYALARQEGALTVYQRASAAAAQQVPGLFMALLYLADAPDQSVSGGVIEQYAPLLPPALQAVLDRYLGKRGKLAPGDFEGYFTALGLVVEQGTPQQLERYVQLAMDFGTAEISRAAQALYQREKWALALLLYGMFPAEAPEVTAEFWHAVGICFYHQREFTAAAECLAKARAAGCAAPDIAAYEQWIGEVQRA